MWRASARCNKMYGRDHPAPPRQLRTLEERGAALLTGCSFCHFTYPRPVDDCRLSRLRLRPGAHLTGKRSWQGSSRASLLGHRATRHAMVRKGDTTRPSAVTTTLRLPPRQQLGIPTYSTPWCPKPGAFPQPSKVFVQGVSLSSPPPHPPHTITTLLPHTSITLKSWYCNPEGVLV